jgi:hypothetical protein
MKRDQVPDLSEDANLVELIHVKLTSVMSWKNFLFPEEKAFRLAK